MQDLHTHVQDLDADVQDLDTDVQDLDTDVQGLDTAPGRWFDPRAGGGSILPPEEDSMAKEAGRSGGAALVAHASKREATMRKRAEDLVALIRRRMQYIADAFFDIGEALREIERRKLYVVLGHASFGEMLAARGLMSRSQATKLVAIVETVPRERALAIGLEKAYALARYVDATPEPDTAESVAEAGVRVEGEPVPLDQLTARDVERAGREARRRSGRDGRADPARREAEARAKAAQAALRAKGARRATVGARRRKDGWWARIDMPIGDLRVLPGAASRRRG